jgi:hypothetical protein
MRAIRWDKVNFAPSFGADLRLDILTIAKNLWFVVAVESGGCEGLTSRALWESAKISR